MSAYWPDSTPTIMSADGVTTYINCSADHFPKDKPSQEWIEKARAEGSYPSIVHRAAVESMLKGVDEKLITDAKLDPKTLDVAAPALGTADEKERAVAEKLAEVVPVAEYLKLASLQASVVKDEKPVDAEPAEEKKP